MLHALAVYRHNADNGAGSFAAHSVYWGDDVNRAGKFQASGNRQNKCFIVLYRRGHAFFNIGISQLRLNRFAVKNFVLNRAVGVKNKKGVEFAFVRMRFAEILRQESGIHGAYFRRFCETFDKDGCGFYVAIYLVGKYNSKLLNFIEHVLLSQAPGVRISYEKENAVCHHNEKNERQQKLRPNAHRMYSLQVSNFSGQSH